MRSSASRRRSGRSPGRTASGRRCSGRTAASWKPRSIRSPPARRIRPRAPSAGANRNGWAPTICSAIAPRTTPSVSLVRSLSASWPRAVRRCRSAVAPACCSSVRSISRSGASMRSPRSWTRTRRYAHGWHRGSIRAVTSTAACSIARAASRCPCRPCRRPSSPVAMAAVSPATSRTSWSPIPPCRSAPNGRSTCCWTISPAKGCSPGRSRCRTHCIRTRSWQRSSSASSPRICASEPWRRSRSCRVPATAWRSRQEPRSRCRRPCASCRPPSPA